MGVGIGSRVPVAVLAVLTACGALFAQVPQKSIFQVMNEYKEFFGGYLLVTGLKAEQEGDEFILEAVPAEGEALKKVYNPKKFKKEDLFLNVRVEDVELLSTIRSIGPGSKVLLLVEVRESAVYNKIIPVFVAHDCRILKATEKADDFQIDTFEDLKPENKKNLAVKEDMSSSDPKGKNQNKTEEPPKRKIMIRRKGN